MDQNSLSRLFRGPFNFFRVDPEELRRIVPDFEHVLPTPQRIFLEQEEATPLLGFAVLISNEERALRQALEGYMGVEEEAQLAAVTGEFVDMRVYERAWQSYEAQLSRATENATRSSFGRHYPSIFWLYHSIAISRLFKEIPRRILRYDLQLGKERGDAIKYRVLERFIGRVLSVSYEIAEQVAAEAEEEERHLFPRLLERMRDNVLILTEDYVSSDLAELDSYFRGCLRLDGKDFRQRFAAMREWHDQQLLVDPELQDAARHLLGVRPDEPPQELIKRPGYVRFLSRRRGYLSEVFLTPELIEVWENLLLKLKEYEILLALRRLVIPVVEKEGRLTCHAPNPRGGVTPQVVNLSTSTRPMEFMNPWVVDPVVRRFGLIYDITDFSAIVSALRRSGNVEQDSSYTRICRFQRQINQMARSHRLKLEKYLGDGALYSGRHPDRLLSMAIGVQRYYQRALDDGFPFDRGLRIALNYGQYRLLPIQGGEPGEDQRYEFFGHGIVELSRLVTGKAMPEIDAVKNLLLSVGYSVSEVDRFFGPVMDRDVDVVDKGEEDRRFFSYLNPSGTLINEGIVVTRDFIRALDEAQVLDLYQALEGKRSYVAFRVGESAGRVVVGVRKLGQANLKGLGRVPLYEAVDGGAWQLERLPQIASGSLLEALERRPAETLST